MMRNSLSRILAIKMFILIVFLSVSMPKYAISDTKDYNLMKILGDLDVSLRQLRSIGQTSNIKQSVSGKASRPKYSRSTQRKDNIISTNLTKEFSNVTEHNVTIDRTRPRTVDGDILCMQKFPISCISENWEIITCQLLLSTRQYPSPPANNLPSLENMVQFYPIPSETSSPQLDGCRKSFKVVLEHVTLDRVSTEADKITFSKRIATNYNQINIFCRRRLKLFVYSDSCNYTTEFDSHSNVIPGQPELLPIKKIGKKQIDFSVRKNDRLRCYYSFVNGIRLQTRITYRSMWDSQDKVIHLNTTESILVREIPVKVSNLIPNSMYTISIQQRTHSSVHPEEQMKFKSQSITNKNNGQLWSPKLELQVVTRPSVPEKPVVSNLTYEYQSTQRQNAEWKHRVILYWKSLAVFEQNGGDFMYLLLFMLEKDSVWQFEDDLEENGVNSPIRLRTELEGALEGISKSLGTTHAYRTKIVKGKAQHDFTFNSNGTAVQVLVFGLNEIGLSAPSERIEIPIATKTTEESASLRPKVSRSAVVQWPNGSYQIFWEFEGLPAASNTDLKDVNVAAVWCEASTSSCLNGIYWKSKIISNANRLQTIQILPQDKYLKSKALFNSHNIDSISNSTSAILAQSAEGFSHVYTGETTVDNSYPLHRYRFGLSFHNIHGTDLSRPRSNGIQWIPCEEISDNIQLKPKLTVGSVSETHAELRISLEACLLQNIYSLGVLVVKWKIMVCQKIPSKTINHPSEIESVFESKEKEDQCAGF